jgi:hypothetical protein
MLLDASCTFPSDPSSTLGPAPLLAVAPREERAATSPAKAVVEGEAEADDSSDDREPLLDAWSLAAKEDGPSCRADLTALGFKFRTVPDKSAPEKSGCGIPHGVLVLRGPTGVTYDPPIMVDCSLARALVTVERIVQEEAAEALAAKIVRIGNLGGFACRPRNSRKGSSLSAHAFGSAVDVSSFTPDKGAPAIVARDYADATKSSPKQDARRRFLRGVYTRLRRHEADLTYVVGPDFNASHRDHFHLDRGGWHFWFNR